MKQQLKAKVFGPKDDTPLTKEDPLFYEINKFYEITINPCNEFQNTLEPFRFKRVHENMKDVFKKLFRKKYYEYYFVPEISEPKFSNKSGSYPRIHYHGIIKYKSPTSVVGFLLSTFHKLREISSFQLNHLRPDHRNKYIHKQKKIIQPVLNQSELDYQLTNMSEKAQLRAFDGGATQLPVGEAENPVRSDK